MEQWQDQAIILSVRPHGESGAIAAVLTRDNGRQAGFVHGAFSSRKRGMLEAGNVCDANWQARVEGSLGTLNLELSRSGAARIMQDPLKLAALQSACSLCDQALPEKEGHPGLYHGFIALLDILESDIWAPAYVMWEIALLKELGFSLDLTKCAGGGDDGSLAYVSPKTGRAVSLAAGALYKERLMQLPSFLKPQGGAGGEEDILLGMQLTGYFLEHWVFAHHSRGLPEARMRFQQRYEQMMPAGPSKKVALF